MTNFIYKYWDKVRLSMHSLGRDARFVWDEYLILEKIKTLGKKLIDVIVMGGLLYYAIHFNNILSYGIAIELAMYYYKWFIETTSGAFKHGRTSK